MSSIYLGYSSHESYEYIEGRGARQPARPGPKAGQEADITDHGAPLSGLEVPELAAEQDCSSGRREGK